MADDQTGSVNCKNGQENQGLECECTMLSSEPHPLLILAEARDA